MDWLALGVLVVIWAILLMPSPQSKRQESPVTHMTVDNDEFRHPGRWILSPKRGSRFVGTRERERQRVRDRRRKVFVFLLEAIGLTGLIGVFPPLRGMLFVTGFFLLLLGIYTALVLRVASSTPQRRVVTIPEAVPDNVVVLPEVRALPDPSLEEQDRRTVRIAR